MLEVILIITVILGWIVAMVWAYWNNGGIEELKKSVKEVFKA